MPIPAAPEESAAYIKNLKAVSSELLRTVKNAKGHGQAIAASGLLIRLCQAYIEIKCTLQCEEHNSTSVTNVESRHENKKVKNWTQSD